MPSLQRCVSVVAFLMLLQILPLLVFAMASAPSPELSFYRAIPSRELGPRDAAGYDRVVLPPGSESREVFVERTPTVTFSVKEMRSVVGHRTETSEELNRMTEEIMRKRGRTPPKEEPEDYTLSITFSEEAAARFREFTKEHDREMFDLRLGGERLNVGRLYGPFPGNTFSTAGLSREMLSRLKSEFPGLIKLQIK